MGRKTDRRSPWMRQLLERRGANRTAVAVANKHARMVWALLMHHQDYQLAAGQGEQRRGSSCQQVIRTYSSGFDVTHNRRRYSQLSHITEARGWAL